MVNITDFIQLVKDLYQLESIPLHRPVFSDRERFYLSDCIESNFVSSVGPKVAEFEEIVAEFVGAERAIACVNGTAALHVSLHAAGVRRGMQVITQALTFVATANAISYCGAQPIFIDVDRDSLGMSPTALRLWLKKNVVVKENVAINKNNGNVIKCCLPMHTFGLPCRIGEIAEVCSEYNITLIEDVAESLGSSYRTSHVGNFGAAAALSFNGNKIITTGGGGMVVTNDANLADRIRHLTTTAKTPHNYEYYHNEIGFNYRMPNLNACVGVAQMEILNQILEHKRQLSQSYQAFFANSDFKYIEPICGATTNNWLNAILVSDLSTRNQFLEITNENGVMTRPIWNLLSDLPMYQQCENDGLKNSRWLADRVVNIPSSVPELT